MQITQGTVSVSHDSSAVTGFGTTWQEDGVKAGDFFFIPPHGPIYQIAQVSSDTAITLTAPWGGFTEDGKPYAIHREFTASGIPLPRTGDAGLAALIARGFTQIQGLHDDPACYPISSTPINHSEVEAGRCGIYLDVAAPKLVLIIKGEDGSEFSGEIGVTAQ